jgi:putative ABC transport system substrate-binding protein
LVAIHYRPIITLAAQHKLPAIYFDRYFVVGGDLISYGPSLVEKFRRAAGYSTESSRAQSLPVKSPNKLGLAINLKTAKAFGLTVPP